MSFKDFLAKYTAKPYENVVSQPQPTTPARESPLGYQYPPTPGLPEPVAMANTPSPDIAAKIDPMLKMVENITGLSRREIFLQLLKSGVRGGGIGGLLDGLLGQQRPDPEAKIVKYIKTVSIWVPVGLGLLAFIGITLILYAKFVISVIGGL